jgi:hypothetical protein
MGSIYGAAVSLDLPLTLLDMSREGFRMHAPIDFPVGDVKQFKFTAVNRAPIVLRAKVVRSALAPTLDGSAYEIGLVFLDRDELEVEATIRAFLDILKALNALYGSNPD